MGKFRRISALLLAFVLCLGLLTAGAGAMYTDDDSIKNFYAVRMLTTLKIFNGERNSDGSYTFNPDRCITRAEFSKLVCVLLNGGEEPVLAKAAAASFSDTQGHWAETYIESLYKMGYIAGYGNGTYGTEDKITGQQASKALLTVIGYNAEKEGLVGPGWATKTDTIAITKGFYEELGSDFSSSAYLTREQAAQIIWNAINVNMVTYKSGYLETMTGDQAKALTFYYEVTVAEGYVLANEYGHVLSAPDNPNNYSPGEGKTEKGKTYVKTRDNVNHLIEISTPASMLGMNVRVVYFTDVKDGETVNIVLSLTEIK